MVITFTRIALEWIRPVCVYGLQVEKRLLIGIFLQDIQHSVVQDLVLGKRPRTVISHVLEADELVKAKFAQNDVPQPECSREVVKRIGSVALLLQRGRQRTRLGRHDQTVLLIHDSRQRAARRHGGQHFK